MCKKKSIATNFINNSIYTALNILFPIVTIPYISRVLEADYLGKVNYAINIVTWFLVFASLGIPRYGVREISRVKDDRRKLSKVFSELFLINLILTIVCVIVYLIAVNNVAYLVDNQRLFWVVGLQLILNIFNVDWFYQGIEEFGYITKRSVFVKTISLVAIFMFVKDKTDYTSYALILTLAAAGNNIFNAVHLRNYVLFSFHTLEMRKHIIPLCFLALAQLAVSLYALLDTTILGYLCGESAVGYYTNSQKIIKAIASLCAALGTVLLPKFIELFSRNNISEIEKMVSRVVSILLWICFPICTGIVLLSEDIALLMFGSDFGACVDTMRILSPFILITTLGNLFGTQLLMAFGEEKQLLKSVLVGTIISIGANLIFIPKYQHNGAALGSICVEAVVMSVQILMCKKHMLIHFNICVALKIALQTSLMAVCVLPIISLVMNPLWAIMLAGIGGGVMYFASGVLLRNDIQSDIYRMFKSKLLARFSK